MSSSNFASFAPYTPPPDESYRSSSFRSVGRPWFPIQSSSLDPGVSYQSGGLPSFSTSMTGGPPIDEVDGHVNQWETRYGMRVDILAALAYILGPVSALVLLIIETKNDFVRFHAYQSALLFVPLVILRMAASLLQLPQLLRSFLSLALFALAAYMAFRAYRDAGRNGLARYHFIFVGELAEQWLADE